MSKHLEELNHFLQILSIIGTLLIKVEIWRLYSVSNTTSFDNQKYRTDTLLEKLRSLNKIYT